MLSKNIYNQSDERKYNPTFNTVDHCIVITILSFRIVRVGPLHFVQGTFGSRCSSTVYLNVDFSIITVHTRSSIFRSTSVKIFPLILSYHIYQKRDHNSHERYIVMRDLRPSWNKIWYTSKELAVTTNLQRNFWHTLLETGARALELSDHFPGYFIGSDRPVA